MKVGTVVKIKEIPGTRLASKRKPVWAVIRWISDYVSNGEENRSLTVEFLQAVPLGRSRSVESMHLFRRNIDIPKEEDVPGWVWAEIAKRELLR